MVLEEASAFIRTESDIYIAQKKARGLCELIGFSQIDEISICTVVLELSKNIYNYAKEGQVIFRVIEDDDKLGLEMTFKDKGPGIPHIDSILSGEYKSQNGLGKGIIGSKNLSDFFEIDTQPNKGTYIRIIKWKKN